MKISLTALKFVLWLLKRNFVLGSNTPVLKMHKFFFLWTVLFPNTQRIESSQHDGNLPFLDDHRHNVSQKLCRGASTERQKTNHKLLLFEVQKSDSTDQMAKVIWRRKIKSASHSPRFPAHTKYEKNCFYTVVKFQPEVHRCYEAMSLFASNNGRKLTSFAILNSIFICLGSHSF